ELVCRRRDRRRRRRARRRFGSGAGAVLSVLSLRLSLRVYALLPCLLPLCVRVSLLGTGLRGRLQLRRSSPPLVRRRNDGEAGAAMGQSTAAPAVRIELRFLT